MRTILTLAITLLFVFMIATNQTPRRICVDLVIDDTRCEGHRVNFPKKICTYDLVQIQNSSSFYCDDTQYFSLFKTWQSMCPLQNLNVTQFCEGTGYVFTVDIHAAPCVALYGCTTDEDCASVLPQAPLPEFKPFCMDCCLFCNNGSACQQPNPSYTNSSDCTPCTPTPSTIQTPLTPTSQSPVNQPQIDTPVGSAISQPNANNEEDSKGHKIPLWTYVVVVIAIVAPLVLLFVLLFRRKCSKVAPSGYGKLSENTVQVLEMDN